MLCNDTQMRRSTFLSGEEDMDEMLLLPLRLQIWNPVHPNRHTLTHSTLLGLVAHRPLIGRASSRLGGLSSRQGRGNKNSQALEVKFLTIKSTKGKGASNCEDDSSRPARGRLCS